MRKLFRYLATISALSSSLPAQTLVWQPAPGHTSFALWPNGTPGAQANSLPEIDTTSAKDSLVAGKPVIRLGNVSTPTLTLYAPESKNTGAAVVVFPGGAYHILAIDLEGTEVCDWLNSAGITCVLLKYRVPDSGPFPKSSAALQDAQRAVGLVRAHAAEWHIDPHRVGVLGFSAGAHLAAALSTHFDQRLYIPVDAADQLSCRPDFAVLIYPGYLALAEQNFAPNPDIQVTDRTPPSFIVQAEDDPVHVENATVYFLALKNAKVPAELHIFAKGRTRLRSPPHRTRSHGLAAPSRELAANRPCTACSLRPNNHGSPGLGTGVYARPARSELRSEDGRGRPVPARFGDHWYASSSQAGERMPR